MQNKRITFGGFAALLLLVMAMAPSAQAIPVAVEISLVVDVSSSINATEYNLQMQGYINAFNNVGIRNLLKSPGNTAAFNMIMFQSGAAQQIGWSLLNTDLAIDSFVASLTNLRDNRPNLPGSSTDIAEGVNLALTSLSGNGFEGTRRVIDVSGDGEQNVDCLQAGCVATLQAARNAAQAAGVTINGLPILTSTFPNLNNYFTNNLITPGGFVIVASGFNTFGTAINQKLEFEITGSGVPEPGTYAMLGCGLLALGFARRYRKG